MPAQSGPVNSTSGQVKQDSLYEHLFMLQKVSLSERHDYRWLYFQKY